MDETECAVRAQDVLATPTCRACSCSRPSAYLGPFVPLFGMQVTTDQWL